jgi:hypothetical protein
VSWDNKSTRSARTKSNTVATALIWLEKLHVENWSSFGESKNSTFFFPAFDGVELRNMGLKHIVDIDIASLTTRARSQLRARQKRKMILSFREKPISMARSK